VTVLNDVVLNQILFSVAPSDLAGSPADAFTEAVIAAIQADGTCWLGGTTWRGRRRLRLSICNYRTSEADIDLSAEAICRAIDQVRGKLT
jgi:hypothetical protein